jgi:hypothetical protein
MTVVRNLRTGQRAEYSCPPRASVLAAFAQLEAGDWHTWEYAERYGSLVRESPLCFSCGDWAAFKDGRDSEEEIR